MKKITVSAPGKLMLFGEHAVVYNRPCLVTAVDQRMQATVELIDAPELQLEAPDVKVSAYKKPLSELGKGDIPKGAKFVEIAVKNFSAKYSLKTGVKVTTKSEFSSLFGFGSSSASTVCVIKALSEITGKKLSQKAIFELAYKTVLDIQGKGSGFDVAAAIYGGILYFVTGGKTIKQVQIKNVPLIVGYTGIKADTAYLVKEVVGSRIKQYPKVMEEIFDTITGIVETAHRALKHEDFASAGALMDINQGLINSMGVSIAKIEAMLFAARDAGAYGGKLSGAGGGDCIIVLAPDGKKEAVEKAMTAVGGEVLTVKTNAEGVRIEK
jgi:mevalonate kinase